MRRDLRTALVVFVVLFILIVSGGLLFPMKLGPTLTWDAFLGCSTIYKACEAYRSSEANAKHNLHELVHPFGGNDSFLPDGANSLIDPWGNRYLLSFDTDGNGREYPLIWTVDTKGTVISQHGIGPKARPQREVQPKK
jgi:hypothetical protein